MNACRHCGTSLPDGFVMSCTACTFVSGGVLGKTGPHYRSHLVDGRLVNTSVRPINEIEVAVLVDVISDRPPSGFPIYLDPNMGPTIVRLVEAGLRKRGMSDPVVVRQLTCDWTRSPVGSEPWGMGLDGQPSQSHRPVALNLASAPRNRRWWWQR